MLNICLRGFLLLADVLFLVLVLVICLFGYICNSVVCFRSRYYTRDKFSCAFCMVLGWLRWYSCIDIGIVCVCWLWFVWLIALVCFGCVVLLSLEALMLFILIIVLALCGLECTWWLLCLLLFVVFWSLNKCSDVLFRFVVC